MKKLLISILLLVALAQASFAQGEQSFAVAVDDESPASDVVLGANIVSQLKSLGYTFPDRTISRLFSAVDATDLENDVTLVIYKGDAIIIGDGSEEFVEDLGNVLEAQDVSFEKISPSKITSSDLEELFSDSVSSSEDSSETEIESVCTDTDSGRDYTEAGTATYGDETVSDSCSGDVLTEARCEEEIETEEHTCPAGCASGACLSEAQPTDSAQPVDLPAPAQPEEPVRRGFFGSIWAWIAGIFS